MRCSTPASRNAESFRGSFAPGHVPQSRDIELVQCVQPFPDDLAEDPSLSPATTRPSSPAGREHTRVGKGGEGSYRGGVQHVQLPRLVHRVPLALLQPGQRALPAHHRHHGAQLPLREAGLVVAPLGYGAERDVAGRGELRTRRTNAPGP